MIRRRPDRRRLDGQGENNARLEDPRGRVQPRRVGNAPLPGYRQRPVGSDLRADRLPCPDPIFPTDPPAWLAAVWAWSRFGFLNKLVPGDALLCFCVPLREALFFHPGGCSLRLFSFSSDLTLLRALWEYGFMDL